MISLMYPKILGPCYNRGATTKRPLLCGKASNKAKLQGAEHLSRSQKLEEATPYSWPSDGAMGVPVRGKTGG